MTLRQLRRHNMTLNMSDILDLCALSCDTKDVQQHNYLWDLTFALSFMEMNSITVLLSTQLYSKESFLSHIKISYLMEPGGGKSKPHLNPFSTRHFNIILSLPQR
jgi:hypothetical protein